jgi:pimeloyl-ACP methyl ester carboxylesterase
MEQPQKSVAALYIHGLRGRMAEWHGQPAAQQKILLVAGIHTSLERMDSTGQFLSDYGHVTMFDLPGIGGMDSFYRIGLQPSLDNYADYLYTAIKSVKLDKRIKIVAMSFGFLVVTRMLQRHPDSKRWIAGIVSFVGFGQASDFKSSRLRQVLYTAVAAPLSTSLGAKLARLLAFNPVSLSVMFRIFMLFNPKYKHALAGDWRKSLRMEHELWRSNDARTRFYLYWLFQRFSLVKGATQIDMALHNMSTPIDQYLDHNRVRDTLSSLYSEVSSSSANLDVHAPSIMGDVQEMRRVFSTESKRLLQPNLRKRAGI